MAQDAEGAATNGAMEMTARCIRSESSGCNDIFFQLQFRKNEVNMRSIRFRGWHKEANVMFSADEIGSYELTINPDGRGFVNVSSVSPQFSQYFNHIIPLQFTGMIDSNGKEIYEGDIVCFSSDESGGVVQWNDESYRFYVADGYDDAGLDEYFELTVIGNIYENPDLLKMSDAETNTT